MDYIRDVCPCCVCEGTWTPNRDLSAVTGFLPRIIKAAPSCAIMISTYEFGKSFFQRLNQEQPLGR